MISICCVGFASLDVVCDELNDYAWNIGLKSVCMYIVSKAWLISSATVIVCAGGAIWLNLFATVLFTVCSAVTVECCVLYPCCVAVLQCLCNYWRRDMGMYEVPLSMSLLGFGMGTLFVSQLTYVWYYVGVKRSFQHAREECESKRAYVFRCLMFNLSGPCELLFLLCYIASWT